MARRLPPAWLCDAAATSCRRRAADIGDFFAADDGLLDVDGEREGNLVVESDLDASPLRRARPRARVVPSG
jgi:hypothetical protein